MTSSGYARSGMRPYASGFDAISRLSGGTLAEGLCLSVDIVWSEVSALPCPLEEHIKPAFQSLHIRVLETRMGSMSSLP